MCLKIVLIIYKCDFFNIVKYLLLCVYMFIMVRNVVCCWLWGIKFFFNGRLLNIWILLFLLRRGSYSVVEVLRIVIIFFERDYFFISFDKIVSGLSFNDGKNVFWLKMMWEIVWVLVIFRLCIFDILVNKNKEVRKIIIYML